MSQSNHRMVIDAHVHLFEAPEALPQVFRDSLYQVWEEKFGKEGAEKRRKGLVATVGALIKDMDEAGIDKSIVCPLDFGIMCRQEPEISIWRNNEYMAEAQSKYPERIIGFAGVDPLRKDAPKLLEKGVKDWGLKGVKVFPTSYKLTDERIQPFMEKVNELEIPVLLHLGVDPLPYLMKYGNPLDMDELTLKYPKMNIIAAHVARGFDHLCAEIVSYRPGRIVIDISQYQHLFLNTHWHFLMQMRYLMDRIPGSVLMASDWPFVKTPPLPTHKEWFDIIRNLKIPEPVMQLGIGVKDFTQEEKDLILGENARRFLSI